MSLLRDLKAKVEVDTAIRSTADKVLVLRFGKSDSSECLPIDDVLMKTQEQLRNMADIYTVDVDGVPIYTQYFEITYTPATVFFFNGQHIKIDWGLAVREPGTPDHTKFIGSFQSKQDFIDVVEVVYRGAMKGKLSVKSPLDPTSLPKYDLLYKDL